MPTSSTVSPTFQFASFHPARCHRPRVPLSRTRLPRPSGKGLSISLTGIGIYSSNPSPASIIDSTPAGSPCSALRAEPLITGILPRGTGTFRKQFTYFHLDKVYKVFIIYYGRICSRIPTMYGTLTCAPAGCAPLSAASGPSVAETTSIAPSICARAGYHVLGCNPRPGQSICA